MNLIGLIIFSVITASAVTLETPHLVDPAALSDELRTAGVDPAQIECSARRCVIRIANASDKDRASAVVSAHRYRAPGERTKARETTERAELVALHRKLLAGTASDAERDRAMALLIARILFP